MSVPVVAPPDALMVGVPGRAAGRGAELGHDAWPMAAVRALLVRALRTQLLLVAGHREAIRGQAQVWQRQGVPDVATGSPKVGEWV